jgi:hypothetical protein
MQRAPPRAIRSSIAQGAGRRARGVRIRSGFSQPCTILARFRCAFRSREMFLPGDRKQRRRSFILLGRRRRFPEPDLACPTRFGIAPGRDGKSLIARDVLARRPRNRRPGLGYGRGRKAASLRRRGGSGVFRCRSGGHGRRCGARPASTQNVADRRWRAVVSPSDAGQCFARLISGYDQRPILLWDFPPFTGSFHKQDFRIPTFVFRLFAFPTPKSSGLLPSFGPAQGEKIEKPRRRR